MTIAPSPFMRQLIDLAHEAGRAVMAVYSRDFDHRVKDDSSPVTDADVDSEAVILAGLFPILHLGRPEFFYYLLPYPNTYDVWPQFRSPLDWDIFAVSTYFTVSLMFWFMGLIPDLASIRDRATTPVRRFFYGLFAVGWRGSARQWHRYERAYLILAALVVARIAGAALVRRRRSFGEDRRDRHRRRRLRRQPGWHRVRNSRHAAARLEWLRPAAAAHLKTSTDADRIRLRT